MKCPTSEALARYVEAPLKGVEHAMIRDHLIHCRHCRRRVEEFGRVEHGLSRPHLLTPPPTIEKSVMRRLFPVLPTYGAVAAFVAASFLLLVSWVYIYFDFAHNSLIQAVQVTSNRLFRFAGAVIQGISAIFSGVYAGFTALSKLLSALLHVNLHAEVLLMAILVMTATPLLLLYRLASQRRRARQNRSM